MNIPITCIARPSVRVGGKSAGMRFLAIAAALALGIVSASAQVATGSATMTSSGTGQYSVTLINSGSTTIGTLWFAWVPGQGYLATSPTNLQSPPGWTATITDGPGGPPSTGNGFSIQWKATGSSSFLAANTTLTGFSFQSQDTPAEVFGNSIYHSNPPVGTSVLYTGAPFSDAGTTIVVAPIPAFFDGQVSVGGNYLFLNFLGYYTINTYPDIYQNELGYLHVVDTADNQRGVYLYDYSGLGWVYTNPTLYPYLYDFQTQSYLYYFTGTNPPVFYNFGTGQFISQ